MKKYFPVLAVICGLILLPHSAFAETKAQAKKREQAEQQRLQRKVTKVLQGERMGVIPDRQKALKTLIESGHAPDEAYWQAGYIKKGDQWVSVEQRWLDRDEEAKLDEYAEVRNPTWNTPEANYELAKWCDQHGLHEQARAHLMSILLDHPDNAQLRQMLGYQKIGNRWMNEEEFDAAVEAAERLAKNLQKWGPVVAEIRAGFDSGDTRKQNAAKVKLEQIDELDAIPALELVLLAGSEQSATACVEQLSTINHRDSTLALCRVALFPPENMRSVQEMAITKIRTRPREDFMVPLLTETASPMSYQIRMLGRSSFRTRLDSFVVQIIGQNESYLSNQEFVHTRFTSIQRRRTPIGALGNNSNAGKIMALKDQLYNPGDQEEQEEIRRSIIDASYTGINAVEEIQDQQSELNEKICGLLNQVIDDYSGQAPGVWWDWWNQQQGTSPAFKPNFVREVSEFDFIEFEKFVLNGSCFVANTPVSTARGLRPIEKLHIGDLVLTKDVESGELTYKPIIRTTVREPKPLVTIDLGPEQITATLGHPFWVSGTGWVKARDLKPGQKIHTPTGSVEVEHVTEAEEREVYNLVVDGFHTYFVGQSQLLCHDVSITSPTDAIVPGLIER